MKTPLLLAGALLAAAGAVYAETSQPPRDPALAAAPVPKLTYRSLFADFRALGDDKAIPWRQANDTVNTIGGWRAYAREAQAPAPAAAAGGGNDASQRQRQP